MSNVIKANIPKTNINYEDIIKALNICIETKVFSNNYTYMIESNYIIIYNKNRSWDYIKIYTPSLEIEYDVHNNNEVELQDMIEKLFSIAKYKKTLDKLLKKSKIRSKKIKYKYENNKLLVEIEDI